MKEKLLLFSIFVIATCGLVYELLAGTLASYLLGDSVTQFSTIIGAYLFSMGVGSWLSRFVKKNLVRTFVRVEILIGILGGFLPLVLFFSFNYLFSFRILLYSMVGLIGVLVGLEIPLLMRLLYQKLEFTDLVSRVFTFDYIGALLASLLFPLVLVPYLGLVRTGFLFGFLNVGVALLALHVFKNEIKTKKLVFVSIFTLIILGFGFGYSNTLTDISEQASYSDPILWAKSSPYQRIVLTKKTTGVRLYLNGNLQFDSWDEYRYHEALVHVGLSKLVSPKKGLILGGGDGLVLREVLKYPSVEEVTLVDLDQELTGLARGSLLSELNHHSFESEKLKLVHADAMVWVQDAKDVYDFIIIDFPDPATYSLGKLYSDSFYKKVKSLLSEDGFLVVQTTSPLIARKSFWCVAHTLENLGLIIKPYHVYVPSFGEWGFILASKKELNAESQFPEGLRFLSNTNLNSLFIFPPDMEEVPTPINKLSNQILVRTFEEEWKNHE